MRRYTVPLLSAALASCADPAAFDPSSRSTALTADARAALEAKVGPALEPLAGEGARLVAVIDRDGDRLLVTAAAPMPEHGHVHFTVLEVSPAGVRLALPGKADAAAFAPGGVVWVDHEGTLRQGEDARAIATGCAPDLAVTADGATALVGVFEPDLDLVTDLAAIDRPTGARRILAGGPGPQGRAVPAPDGRRVLFVDGKGSVPALAVLDLETGRRRALSTPGPLRPGAPPTGFVPPPARREGLAFLSPDLLAYDAGGGERWSVDLDTGRAEALP